MLIYMGMCMYFDRLQSGLARRSIKNHLELRDNERTGPENTTKEERDRGGKNNKGEFHMQNRATQISVILSST